jgi:vacuolar-type H+-ATPase subunit I/STV1
MATLQKTAKTLHGLISEDSTVEAAQQRLDRATTKQAEAQATVCRLHEQLAEIRERGSAALAEVLLHSDDVDEDDSSTEIHKQLTAAQNLADAWAQAVKAGQRELESARLAVADRLYQQHRPEYLAIVKRQIDLLASLAQVVDEESAFVQRFAAVGYSPESELFPPVARLLRLALLKNSSLFAYVDRLLERRVLTLSDVPESLRRGWGVS